MKKAFTLSEVLITLGIIGAVAILVIPSLVKNYRYKVYSAQLQKTYSQIQNAIDTAMADESSHDFYQTTSGTKNFPNDCSKGPCYFANKYFKLARTDCGYTSSGTKCVADSYKTLNGVNAGLLIPNVDTAYCAQTINGATICFMNNDWTNYKTRVTIDVNGPEAPNIVGIDAFIMSIFDNKLSDGGNPDDCGAGNTAQSDINGHA